MQGIRQPLESGVVQLTRAEGNVTFPARFMLVAATNPCPCGYYGDDQHECTCTLPQIRSYQNKIGGPLMDRIDIHLDVRRIPPVQVLSQKSGASSQDLKEGVLKAREFARCRAKHEGGFRDMRNLRDLPEGEVRDFLIAQAELQGLSGRGIVRTLAVARTIADMDESMSLQVSHLAEALCYRTRLE
jgi:magnesium chelatase family protein